MTTYLTPARYGEAEFVEKRSRFIGRVWRTDTEAEALEKIREMRERHRDATHNVYAYIIRENNITRYSDDGEPSGTSGMPVLNVFATEGITNVCCVVTRYFGGTLLGTGGLVHAYSKAAKEALDAAGVSLMALWSLLRISISYSFYDRAVRLLDEFEASVLSSDFGENVSLQAPVRKDIEETFLERMTEYSAGKAIVEKTEERFCGVRVG
ncbi:MAG: YigZ family protein [Clostridiales bacterium]|nr:YigZ family protein [Clostridiales bacterium]